MQKFKHFWRKKNFHLKKSLASLLHQAIQLYMYNTLSKVHKNKSEIGPGLGLSEMSMAIKVKQKVRTNFWRANLFTKLEIHIMPVTWIDGYNLLK